MVNDLHITRGFDRAADVTFRFDGRTMIAADGENLAAALYASGVRRLRRNREDGGPRGPFCFIGICQECLVVIDGRLTEACRTPVRQDLNVTSAQ
jgi:predicted molibdopterin-dependent oxidoreductase YjgC